MLATIDPLTRALGDFAFYAMTILAWVVLIGTPVLFYVAIRFLWYRHVYIGKSKEMETLIWQLHRIATALEHQAGVAYPTDQPGTEPHKRGVHLSAFDR